MNRKTSHTPGLTADQRGLIELNAAAKNIRLKPAPGARSVLAGNHFSRFRGRGMDFAESRAYQPGDDVRRIDWRVTARTGETFTKIYIEEREQPVWVVADFSSSLFFGTRKNLKSVAAAEAGALLAWAAVHQGDRVGGILSSSLGIQDFKPRNGRRGALQIIHALSEVTQNIPKSGDKQVNSLLPALEHLSRVAHPGSLIILLSDFYYLDESARKLIGKLRTHNDMMFLEFSDPLEKQAPEAGQYSITDGQQTAVIDTYRANARQQYTQPYRHKLEQLELFCKQIAIPLIGITNGDDVVLTLQQALTTRRNKVNRSPRAAA